MAASHPLAPQGGAKLAADTPANALPPSIGNNSASEPPKGDGALDTAPTLTGTWPPSMRGIACASLRAEYCPCMALAGGASAADCPEHVAGALAKVCAGHRTNAPAVPTSAGHPGDEPDA